MSKIESRIQFKRDTTENWNNARGFIPLAGEVIVYNDYKTIKREINGVVKDVNVPWIKIGTGNAYIQDLPFVEEDINDRLMEHINNMEIHTTLQEKAFWNNKINVDDSYELIHGELVDETLVLTRN